MISLKELAARCNVSIATISNILNGKSNVSEETKKRVMAVIKETGYKPNFMASRLRASRTKTIGIIVDELSTFSTPTQIDGIMDVCEANGFKTVLENLRIYVKHENNPDKPEYIKALDAAFQEMLAIKVEGIIFVAAHSRVVKSIPENLGIPIVIAYAHGEDSSIPSVEIDDFQSAFAITQYLISKNKKNIGIITGVSDNFHYSGRLEGYKKALEENHLPFDSSLLADAKWNRGSGKEACLQILKSSKNLDALFCMNDLMAAGAFEALKENNLQPGKDVSVIGFDNREISEYLEPQLSTMEIPLRQIGQTAADIVVKKINGTEIESNQIFIPCRLIERQSV